MSREIQAIKTLEAIRRYKAGEKPGVSTFIDEVTYTYGYGELSDLGEWEYEIPHEHLCNGEPLRYERTKD